MKRIYAGIVFCNLLLSLCVVYVSPRWDIYTLLGLILVNLILYALLMLHHYKQKKSMKHKIEGLFHLLHAMDVNSDQFEVDDDEFGKLRDEIYKMILENKVIAGTARENQEILRGYTEDIAHQIKTPLTGVLLMLDLIEADPEHTKDYVTRIRSSMQRLHGLTAVLLKMASLDSGVVKMQGETVSAKGLIEDIKRDLEVYFADRDILIDGADFPLLCDRQWTYEAIFNIMKNGLEASPEKGIVVALQESNVYKSVMVTDFGQGLSNDTLKKAYQRFYKIDPNSPGYGIGLPLAKAVMAKQNGELLYSKDKAGNHFELRFYK